MRTMHSIVSSRASLLAAATLAIAGVVQPAEAALPVGAKAPLFTTVGAKGGKEFQVDLARQLKKGPVVLYFYPAAFTQGCTLEAHAFAEASDDFAKLHATVIGMSADDLPTLQRFSTEECRSKFAVAVASPAVIKAYDVKLDMSKMKMPPPGKMPAGAPAAAPPAAKMPDMSKERTNRTSYVIAPDGKIVMVHSESDYRDHVRLTMAAVEKLAAK